MPASAIATFGLTKFYGPNRGIEDLSVNVEPGEVFGFLGPNGAGKSTTIRALMGLQRPSRGRASILGFDIWSHSVEVHRRVGYLPGGLALFDRMTGRQHVEWFARARGVDVSRALAVLVDRLEVVLDRVRSENSLAITRSISNAHTFVFASNNKKSQVSWAEHVF